MHRRVSPQQRIIAVLLRVFIGVTGRSSLSCVCTFVVYSDWRFCWFFIAGAASWNWTLFCSATCAARALALVEVQLSDRRQAACCRNRFPLCDCGSPVIATVPVVIPSQMNIKPWREYESAQARFSFATPHAPVSGLAYNMFHNKGPGSNNSPFPK